MTVAEKKKLDQQKKRETASNQYTPFVTKRKYNSRYQEYQVAEWRFKKGNLYVTMDTIVPSMPKNPLKEPDDSKYHLEVSAIEDQIEKLNEEFKELKATRWSKKSEMVDG